jgi:Pvc16 N-terminal domain/IPT/TIG domain
MTNYHAIATVTAVLQDVLSKDLTTIYHEIAITAKPPDIAEKETGKLRLNLYLYHVLPNTGFSTLRLPVRNRDGNFVKRPMTALNLYYLMTVYPKEENIDLVDLDPQQVLARAMTVLEESSTLMRDHIFNIRNTDTLKPILTALSTEDFLEDQIEQVKISLHPASLEEMNKLWSSFFQTHYRLSVAYIATVVLLDSKKTIPPSLPVQERKLYVIPSSSPVIDRIEPQVVERVADTQIKIIGVNLYAENVKVFFDNMAVIPEATTISMNQISIKLPPSLHAGVKTVRVVHPLIAGDPPVEHLEWQKSNVGAFVLSPSITDPVSKITRARGEHLSIKVSPGVASGQKVSLLIGHNEFEINVPPPAAPGEVVEVLPDFQIPLTLPITSIPDNPPYIIRVRIDGADSFVHVDKNPGSPTFGEYLPSLEVT